MHEERVRDEPGGRGTGDPDRDWFYWREAIPGLWLIAEPSHVYTWLVVGSERACLFDTGTGFAPIRPVVEEITSLPLVVVNSHYHFDHVGGNREFPAVSIHPAGVDRIYTDFDASVAAYLAFLRHRERALRTFRRLDAELLGLLTIETNPRDLPSLVEDRALGRGRPNTEVHVIEHGDTIDLGDRVLRVLHTPGHSPDGISLLDEANGLLLTADAFNLGLVYCHFQDSDLGVLTRTAARLAGLSSDIAYVTTHHYPRVIAEPNLLVAYREALERIDLSVTEPGADILGQKCLTVSFDHFMITVPDPEHPAQIG
jgi:glyoxylase-like metal-dependent hydrolase (beta-lactamase superfamily II)